MRFREPSKLKLKKIKRSQGYEYRLVDSGGRTKVYWLHDGDGRAHVNVNDPDRAYWIEWIDDEEQMLEKIYALLICALGREEYQIYRLKKQIGGFFYNHKQEKRNIDGV